MVTNMLCLEIPELVSLQVVVTKKIDPVIFELSRYEFGRVSVKAVVGTIYGIDMAQICQRNPITVWLHLTRFSVCCFRSLFFNESINNPLDRKLQHPEAP